MKTKEKRILNKEELLKALKNSYVIEELFCNHTKVAYEMGIAKKTTQWKTPYNENIRRIELKEVTEWTKTNVVNINLITTIGAYEKVNWILFQWDEIGNNRDGLADFARTFMEEK